MMYVDSLTSEMNLPKCCTPREVHVTIHLVVSVRFLNVQGVSEIQGLFLLYIGSLHFERVWPILEGTH